MQGARHTVAEFRNGQHLDWPFFPQLLLELLLELLHLWESTQVVLREMLPAFPARYHDSEAGDTERPDGVPGHPCNF